jgi:hypothetical protein
MIQAMTAIPKTIDEERYQQPIVEDLALQQAI